MEKIEYAKDIYYLRDDLPILRELNLFYRFFKEDKIILLYFGNYEIIIYYGIITDYKFNKGRKDLKVTRKNINDILKGIIENERKQ